MIHQGQQLALPAPHTAATHNTPRVQKISGVHRNEPISIAHVHEGHAEQAINYIDIMVSSGVATHVCPPLFAQEFPIRHLQETRNHNCAPSRMMRSSSMDTNGFACTMLKDNQSSYHSTSVAYNNPLYPYQGLKNKALN